MAADWERSEDRTCVRIPSGYDIFIDACSYTCSNILHEGAKFQDIPRSEEVFAIRFEPAYSARRVSPHPGLTRFGHLPGIFLPSATRLRSPIAGRTRHLPGAPALAPPRRLL